MFPKNYQNAQISISKEQLNNFPAECYKGKIKVIDDPDLINDAICELRKSEIIGFDTETRPSFKRGQHYNVALIQLADNETCYLFRTNIIGFPKQLIDLLEDPAVTKVGLSIHDDFLNLKKSVEINPDGFVELQSYVRNYKIADASLSKVYAILFGKRISKGQRLSNWESPELTDSQQGYAALDATACIDIYNYLEGGNFKPENSPYLTWPSEDIKEIEKSED